MKRAVAHGKNPGGIPEGCRRCSIWTMVWILCFLAMALPCRAESAGGVEFAPERRADGRVLTLRGTAVLRYMLFVKAYAGGFYLVQGAAAENALDEVARELVLHYFVDISAADFAEATSAMIEKNVPTDRMERIRPNLEQMNVLYRDVRAGDRYEALYIPGKGTSLALNGELLGTVAGDEFSAAFFAIWIGENPIDKDFRDKLLGEQ